jgi:hypothetical protein
MPPNASRLHATSLNVAIVPRPHTGMAICQPCAAVRLEFTSAICVGFARHRGITSACPRETAPIPKSRGRA